jgi:hypothetical protein
MNHATEGMLQAFLDEEVAGADRREIADHLGACSACAAEYETMRAAAVRVSALLAALDRPVAVQSALAAVRQHGAAAPATPRQLGRRRWRGALTRAALFIVASATVVSATVPGSPVRQWLVSAWDRVATFFVGERDPMAVDAPPAVVVEEAGAWVTPYQGRVRVVLDDALPEATIRIQLVDRQRAGVMAAEVGARFSTGTGRVEAAEIGARDVVVELPIGAQSAVVEVNGRVVASKDGEALVAHVPMLSMTQYELVLRPNR